MKKVIFCLTFITIIAVNGVIKNTEEITVDQLPGMTTDNVINNSKPL